MGYGSIHNDFCEETFVFEITFWELFTNGRRPYDDLNGNEVISRAINGNIYPKIDISWPIADILTTIFTGDGKVIYDGRTLFDSMKNIQGKCNTN